jgi:hypothetical protein
LRTDYDKKTAWAPFPPKTGCDKLWVTFSQTHLVTLFVFDSSLFTTIHSGFFVEKTDFCEAILSEENETFCKLLFL